jgi:hypothetical protein
MGSTALFGEALAAGDRIGMNAKHGPESTYMDQPHASYRHIEQKLRIPTGSILFVEAAYGAKGACAIER